MATMVPAFEMKSLHALIRQLLKRYARYMYWRSNTGLAPSSEEISIDLIELPRLLTDFERGSTVLGRWKLHVSRADWSVRIRLDATYPLKSYLRTARAVLLENRDKVLSHQLWRSPAPSDAAQQP
jgi:hypothetical protein